MMAWTVQVCDAALHKMYEASEPGRTENEIWSELHRENIRNGGEWIETRLLATGTRTTLVSGMLRQGGFEGRDAGRRY